KVRILTWPKPFTAKRFRGKLKSGLFKLATDPHGLTQTFCSADTGRTKNVIPLRGIKNHV
ncbi:MAG: hypothetical protein PVF25_16640, partial [Desulfobacterales bacterium]